MKMSVSASIVFVIVVLLSLYSLGACALAAPPEITNPPKTEGMPVVTVEVRAIYDRNDAYYGMRVEDTERGVLCYILSGSVSCVNIAAK